MSEALSFGDCDSSRVVEVEVEVLCVGRRERCLWKSLRETWVVVVVVGEGGGREEAVGRAAMACGCGSLGGERYFGGGDGMTGGEGSDV